MKETATLFVFACIFLLLSFLFRNSGKEKRMDGRADAIIYNVSHYDADVNYYVKFEVDGKVITGKTVAYRSGGKSYARGDCVPIEYYFTKTGWVRAKILDDEMKAFGETAKAFPKLLFRVSVGFFVLAVVMAVRNVVI